jgi:hypothetical protein
MIIRRLYALDRQKRPQRLFHGQQIRAERDDLDIAARKAIWTSP